MSRINKKGLVVSLMIATLTVAMLSAFVIPASASTEHEWTYNSSLIKDDGGWDTRLWHWSIGHLEPAQPDENNYCDWTADGTVESRVEDSVITNPTYFVAANLDQGTARSSIPASCQPRLLRFASCDEMTLEADVENCHTTDYVFPINFVGIKFDVWAVVDQEDGSTKLMTEMYFVRDGANLIWYREHARKTDPNSDVWNYLVDLTHPDFSDYVTETKYGADSAIWTIDVKYFVKRGAEAHNINFHTLNLAQVSFTMESGEIMPDAGPVSWGTIHKLKVTYCAQLLHILVSNCGTTNPPAGTYVYNYGETVTVKAYPDTYMKLYYWILDGYVNYGNLPNSNSITITMDSDHTLSPAFGSQGNPGGGGGGPGGGNAEGGGAIPER